MPIDYTAPHTPIYARDPSSKPILLDGAMEGHVLVKNVNNALPLKSPKLLSIFGYDAPAPRGMDVGAPGNSDAPFIWGFEPELVYQAWNYPAPIIAINGTMISGGEFLSQ